MSEKDKLNNKVAVGGLRPLNCSADAPGQNAKRMTPKQIQNWRKMIPALFGFPGSFLSDDEIHDLRDKIQNAANNL